MNKLVNGEVISDVAEPVQSVAVGTKAGFPLKDIVGAVASAALFKAEALQDELTAANREIERLRAELAKTKGES